MIRSELNINFVQAVLYYIYQQVSRLYDPYGTSVGTWGYDENYDLIIIAWYIGDVAQPSIETLLSFDLETVLVFYHIEYQLVIDINESQGFIKLSSSDLTQVPTNSFAIGTIVQDSVSGAIKIWNGSIWS